MPVKKTDYEEWVRAGLALLDGARADGDQPEEPSPGPRKVIGTGRYLPEVKLSEICALVAKMNGLPSLSKGSFYNHFHDGLMAFYQAVIDAWKKDRDRALEDSQVTVIENPADRLRVLRSYAEKTAVRADAIRRWAAAADAGEEGADEAASALAASNDAVLAILTAALADLGLPSGRRGADGMAQTYARVIAAEFGCGRGPMTIEPGDADGFRNLMRGLTVMAARPQHGEAGDQGLDVSTVETPGGNVTVFVVTSDVDPGRLRAAAQEFATRVAAADPPGSDAAAPPARRGARRRPAASLSRPGSEGH